MSNRAVDVLIFGAMILLPLSALITRRPALGSTLKMAAAWIGIFALGLLIAGQRYPLPAWTSLTSDQRVTGGETRITQAGDGHFYADVVLDGVRRRMLVDSDATTTALSVATDKAIGPDLDESSFPVILETVNGRIRARTATVAEVRVGDVATTLLAVVVSPAFGDGDVLGINFLSRLGLWRVEDRTLILSPKRD